MRHWRAKAIRTGIPGTYHPFIYDSVNGIRDFVADASEQRDSGGD